KNPDLGPIQEKNKTGQTTKEESPEITPEATVEPNERDSIPSLATSTPEPETGEAPVSPRIEPQEHIPDNNEKETAPLPPQEEVPSQLRMDSNNLEKQTPAQLENLQEPPSEPTTADTTSAASPDATTILPEDADRNSVSEGQSEIESQDIRFIQSKNETDPSVTAEQKARPQETEEKVSETDEQNSSDFLPSATQESETVVNEPLVAQNEKTANPQNVDPISLEKDATPEIQKPPELTSDAETELANEKTTRPPESLETGSFPAENLEQNSVSEDGQLSNIESESQIQDAEPVSEFDRNDLSAVPAPLLEEIDELASITRSELSENPPDDGDETTESTQLDKPGEARSAAVTTLDEPQASQPENLSLEETPEQNAQKEFFPTVEENQEQNPVIQQQRDVEQNEQALKPEEENLWPDQENNVGESVVNQNQEDEIDQLVRSEDPRVASSQLHTHENADPPKISQEPHQQTKVAAPFGSNGGQKTGVPFGSKDETIFSKSSPQTSITPNFYKKQLRGRSSLTVIKTVLIALIPISVIYLLIVVTFDANFMNRLSSLKESFFIKKTESKNSSNSNPLTSYEPAEANQTNSDEIASTRPIISGKSGTSFQANLPPVSELKLQLSVRGSGLPQASDIFVSGAHYGKTNNQGRMLLSNLTVNQSYIIKVEKQGFEMWAKEVSFSTLGTKDLNVALKPLPSKALSNSGQKIGQSTVTILLSNPQNVSSATIYIDGKLWGGRDNIAPAKLQIPAGDHIVEVKQDGFRSHPASQSLTLANGENRTIYFYLIPN
ncbi:PEGA domain-containing protein, partial [candidate division KSB1 bacterium]|nr:PEGA domain-containing protein [candidate division KSB1 bacterium]